MNVKGLFTDDSAVSPVIGVVLMVAITVLLAATAATFFIGVGQDNSNSTPQAAFSSDYSQDSETNGGDTYRIDQLKISHNSGDTITAKEIDIVVSDAQVWLSSDTHKDLNHRFQWHEIDGDISAEDGVSGGTSVRLDQDNIDSTSVFSDQVDGLDLDGASVKVVWQDPGGSSSFTLHTWQD